MNQPCRVLDAKSEGKVKEAVQRKLKWVKTSIKRHVLLVLGYSLGIQRALII
jgi:hypothetical protein